jgi:hypothetical protein
MYKDKQWVSKSFYFWVFAHIKKRVAIYDTLWSVVPDYMDLNLAGLLRLWV